MTPSINPNCDKSKRILVQFQINPNFSQKPIPSQKTQSWRVETIRNPPDNKSSIINKQFPCLFSQ